MTGDLFQNRYRIASLRALWHNYNGGMYFVTICTKGRRHYFGEILHGEFNEAEPIMNLTIIGQYANVQFSNVTSHYPYAKIPLWVVMPNHIHAVVIIEGDEIPYERRNIEQAGVLNDVETGRMVNNVETLRAKNNVETLRATSLQGKNIYMSEKSPKPGTLATIVRGIKSAISRYAHENAIPFAWQPRFHDRIIRDTDEMNRIAKYIEHNVAKWSYDE